MPFPEQVSSKNGDDSRSHGVSDNFLIGQQGYNFPSEMSSSGESSSKYERSSSPVFASNMSSLSDSSLEYERSSSPFFSREYPVIPTFADTVYVHPRTGPEDLPLHRFESVSHEQVEKSKEQVVQRTRGVKDEMMRRREGYVYIIKRRFTGKGLPVIVEWIAYLDDKAFIQATLAVEESSRLNLPAGSGFFESLDTIYEWKDECKRGLSFMDVGEEDDDATEETRMATRGVDQGFWYSGEATAREMWSSRPPEALMVVVPVYHHQISEERTNDYEVLYAGNHFYHLVRPRDYHTRHLSPVARFITYRDDLELLVRGISSVHESSNPTPDEEEAWNRADDIAEVQAKRTEGVFIVPVSWKLTEEGIVLYSGVACHQHRGDLTFVHFHNSFLEEDLLMRQCSLPLDERGFICGKEYLEDIIAFSELFSVFHLDTSPTPYTLRKEWVEDPTFGMRFLTEKKWTASSLEEDWNTDSRCPFQLPVLQSLTPESPQTRSTARSGAGSRYGDAW